MEWKLKMLLNMQKVVDMYARCYHSGSGMAASGGNCI